MFVFKLWSRFGAFRDPITITQNVTLSIPPKTVVGGILAAILGMEYNDYFENSQYFDFGYSLVLLNPIRKQSFSQNYIEDYTKKSHMKHDTMLKSLQKSKSLDNYKKKRMESLQTTTFGNTDNDVLDSDEKYQKELIAFQNELTKLDKKLTERMPKPKPIRRELLLNPSYLIFIKDFEFENQIIEQLKSHNTGFALFMGNSEFSANYNFVECFDFEEKSLFQVNSFTQLQNNVKFESNRKYTSIYAATKVVKGRKYRDFKKMMICEKEISFNTSVNGVVVKTEEGAYNCEFI